MESQVDTAGDNQNPISKYQINKYFDQLFSGNIWAASWQNQQNDLCTQQRLRSAWASAKSDQSLRCPHEERLEL